MQKNLKNLKDTQKLAQDLIKKWQKEPGPLIVALYGDLGSSKTTFTQFLAKALKIKEKILSPTFLIIKSFCLLSKTKFKFLYHLDCYRLKSAKDLVVLGLKDILTDKENIVVIEWAEKVERYLPRHTKKIYFEVVGHGERKITIK